MGFCERVSGASRGVFVVLARGVVGLGGELTFTPLKSGCIDRGLGFKGEGTFWW
jgi:hypothetical protein